MRIDTGKQLSVDGNIFIRSKTESLLKQKFCNSDRNLVSLFDTILDIMGRILFIISLQKLVCLFKGYLSLDIANSCMHQIFGCLQSVNCLQANGRILCIPLVPLIRF